MIPRFIIDLRKEGITFLTKDNTIYAQKSGIGFSYLTIERNTKKYEKYDQEQELPADLTIPVWTLPRWLVDAVYEAQRLNGDATPEQTILRGVKKLIRITKRKQNENNDPRKPRLVSERISQNC